ncbi:MAG: MoaD/ThiS family protein [Planctomycetes bacterium]|nr:MoaD/ThiS family protein [Planctomycetota bacterium]
MATVWIPALLRSFTNQSESIQVPGATLGELIDALEAKFPGIKARLCDGPDIRPGLAVVIDTQIARGGLSEVVQENSEVHFIPAIAGGAWPVVRDQWSVAYPPGDREQLND